MSVSRVVALLTPLFAALSGYITVQAAKLPGAPALNRDELTALFVLGATSGTAAGLKWLHGRSKHELAELAETAATAREAAWAAAQPEEGGDDRPEPSTPDLVPVPGKVDLEALRAILGLNGLEADTARALRGVLAQDVRLEQLEQRPFPQGAGSTHHHPV